MSPRIARRLAFALLLTPAPVLADDIRVGAVSDLTGAYSEVGRQMADAKDLAARHVNAEGGLLGGDRLVLVRGDSRCNAEDGFAAGQAVTSPPGVVAIAGATCSGATIAMSENFAVPLGLPVISPSATAPVISGMADDDLVFRMSPSDLFLAEQLSAMVLNRGISRVAVTYATDAYNAGVGQAFIDEFQANGGIVTAVAPHEPEGTNYTGLIDTIASAETDTLMVFAYYDATGVEVINAALADQRFEIFIGADGMINDALITQVGAENLSWALFMIAASDDRSRAFRAYAELAEAAGLNPATPFTAQSYDAVFLLALAIEKAGSADPAAIQAALRDVANEPGVRIYPGEWAKAKELIAAGEDIDYWGASGRVEFDPAGDTSGLFSVNTVKSDGSWDIFVLR